MEQVYLLWIYSMLLCCVRYSCGHAILSSNRSIPIVGLPLLLTYRHEDVNNLTTRVSFYLGSTLQGVCEGYSNSNGTCESEQGHDVTRQSGNVITLVIASFDESQHAGVWRVQDGSYTFSNTLDFVPPFTTVVNTSLINYDKACPTQEQVDSKSEFRVSVTTACSYPGVDIAWFFLGKMYHSETTSNATNCSSPQVRTTSMVTINYKDLQGSVHIAVHMNHPSFKHGAFDQLICVPNYKQSRSTTFTFNAKVTVVVLGVVISLCIIAVLVLMRLNLIRLKKKRYELKHREVLDKRRHTKYQAWILRLEKRRQKLTDKVCFV